MPRAAVLGSPISHSRSPALHRAAYAALGLDWQYDAIECAEDAFPEFLASLSDEWRGLSLTMPLKEIVFEVVDDIDNVARAVHSANTVWRENPSSAWKATNTDIAGIRRALAAAGVERVERVRILGAGATARSAVAAVIGMGATSIVVHARRSEAAAEVAALAERLGCSTQIGTLDPDLFDQDLLVSTLPADSAGPWASAVSSADIAATGLLDASYYPWPTPLALAWSRYSPDAPVANGRDMLLWQAVDQVRLMTGKIDHVNEKAVVEAMRGALSTADNED